MKILSLSLLLFSVTLSHGQTFNGVWTNEGNGEIVSLVISGESQVQAFRKCQPTKCNLGTSKFRRARTISGQTTTSAIFNDRGNQWNLKFYKLNNNRLKVTATYSYANRNAQKNFTFFFKRSTRAIAIDTNRPSSTVRQDYYAVTIRYIKCIDPNDLDGDEAEFLFLRDDQPSRRFNKFLDVDDRLNLGGTYEFQDVFTIKFYDNDAASRDDYLGQWQLKNPKIGNGGDYIYASGSKYFISYTVAKKVKMVKRNPRNITIELLDLICDKTEDDAGNDEPFILGGMIMGDQSAQLVIRPMSINDNQNKGFRIPERIMYNGPIPPNADRLTLDLVVMEEDAKATWLRNEQNYQRLARNIGRGLDELTQEPGTDSDLGEAISEVIFGTLGELIKTDEDDLLKDMTFDFDLKNLRVDDKVFHWSWAGHGGSRYTVRFRVTGRR